MIILFRILMVFVGMGCLLAFIISLATWTDDTLFCYPKIKFASFKKFYEINPNRWVLHSGHVECKIDGKSYAEKFRFSCIGYWKYKLWSKQQEDILEQERHNRSIQRMMDAVKQDIADSETEAKRMQEKLLADLRQQCDVSDDILFDIMKLVEEYKEKIW